MSKEHGLDEEEEKYKTKYSRIQDKLEKRNNYIGYSLVLLIVPIFIVLFANIINIYSIIFVLIGVATACFIFFTILNKENFKISLRDYLFIRFFGIYINLEKFIADRDKKDKQVVIDSLDKLYNRLSNLKTENGFYKIKTGFDSDKFVIALKKLHESIPQYQKEINQLNQEKDIKKYLDLFRILAIYCDEGNMEELSEKINKEYKPKKNIIFFIFDKDTIISLKNPFKYILSFVIYTIFCFIIVNGFNIPIGNDLNSISATIISFFIISGGIKKFILDGLEELIVNPTIKND